MTKVELLQFFDDYLLIPANHVVNEYGMTELGVQFYDSKLRTRSQKSEVRGQDAEGKAVPPWSRVLIIDPATGQEVPEGERGLIRVYDLTNRSSVMAVQTEDIGVRRGESFEILGRAEGAEARGCSIAADELVMANAVPSNITGCSNPSAMRNVSLSRNVSNWAS